MTDYKIISDASVKEFEMKVKAALAEGWKLQGGVTTHNFFYSQAVIKEDKPVKSKP